ncbi:MAG: aminoacetone oxidase family FAD-binding enzyme [Burkholderiales bacterium]|jgi:predicted Rossmann fold flavoprotein|nr:aminoacetone oxidase family FAD-binding enzyme [Burkholderiales bacterium]
MTVEKYDSIIIGAGAAGLMCAYTASVRGKKILLIDHSNKLAEKIRISGGGRCNFTNIFSEPKSYISANPNFCISALTNYTPHHFTGLLDKHHITYHEKTLGQLFCDNSAEDIIKLLDHLCNINNVIRKMPVKVLNINKMPRGFELTTNNIGIVQAETLVIATGGLSIPQIGATGFGYNIARDFGLNIIKTEPALVPLALDPIQLEYFSPLSGSSFYSQTKIDKMSFLENTLITHRGLSGPAILQISSYYNPGANLQIDMLPAMNITQQVNENRKSNKLLSNFLALFFSERIANSLCKILKLDKQLSQLSNKEILHINELIHNFIVTPSGTLGYKKAEVTRGGVDTHELSSKTLESRKIDGLFFIGEVVDVTGWLGGYNFQWAWASAHAAGNNL